MPQTPAIALDLVIGYITDVEPAVPGPRGSHAYVGIVQTSEGQRPDVPIGPSSEDGWDLPTHVRPLKRGKAILGVRVNGEIQWFYQEAAKVGNCGPAAAVSVVSPLLGLDKEGLRWLKRMLAEVDA